MLNTTESLYVGLTRARSEAFIYADQDQDLIKQFEQGQEKSSTIEQGEREAQNPEMDFKDIDDVLKEHLADDQLAQQPDLVEFQEPHMDQHIEKDDDRGMEREGPSIERSY